MVGKLLTAGLFAVCLASAQRGGGMGGGDEMGMGGGMGGGGGRRGGGDMGASMPMGMQRRASKPELIADKLKLDKEQKEELSKILSAGFERAGSVRPAVDRARLQLAGAMIDGKSGDDLKKLKADYVAAAAQMTRIEADAFGKIYAILKPNQQAKADQAFEVMAGMFSAGGAGSGRGIGRGRGEGR